jgi:hypothetical protein
MAWNETNPTALDVYERAFGIIANAHGGNWNEASPEWRRAAENFRDAYHAALARRGPHQENV